VPEFSDWENVEAYVDDVVVKTTKQDQLIADLAETFTNLREYQWKLNPTKCVFGVPSGLLLGFMVKHQGIEANPVKVDAIRNMAKPYCKKDVMKLTCMMAALGRFISKLSEKCLPFFKLLIKKISSYGMKKHRRLSRLSKTPSPHLQS
jgi:hypothetical protein